MTTLWARSAGAPAPATTAVSRAAAVLALASAVVHLLLADLSSLGSLAMLGMALACLPCAWHLWSRPSAGIWGLAVAVDAAMLVLHAQLLSAPAGHAHAGGHGMGPLLWFGLGLVAAQIALAALAGAVTLRR